MDVRHHPVPVLSCSDGKTEKQRVPFGFFRQTLNEGPLCAGDRGQTKNLTHGLYQLMDQLMAPVPWWWVVDTGREEWLPVSLLPFFIPPFIILVSLSLSLFLFFELWWFFQPLGALYLPGRSEQAAVLAIPRTCLIISVLSKGLDIRCSAFRPEEENFILFFYL